MIMSDPLIAEGTFMEVLSTAPDFSAFFRKSLFLSTPTRTISSGYAPKARPMEAPVTFIPMMVI